MHRVVDVDSAWGRAVLLIQSYRRMLPVRRAFVAARAASVQIQAAERGRVARRDFAELKRRHAAATRVQTRYRGHRARVDYLRTLRAVLVLQIAFRRWQVTLRHLNPCSVIACCSVPAVEWDAPRLWEDWA